jgi:hypothetical protein
MVMLNHYKLDQNQSIPQYSKWIITRWDFGRHALQTYRGKNYEITVESAEYTFARIYTKDFGKYKKKRLEEIQCPNKTVIDAVEEKLNILDSSNIGNLISTNVNNSSISNMEVLNN